MVVGIQSNSTAGTFTDGPLDGAGYSTFHTGGYGMRSVAWRYCLSAGLAVVMIASVPAEGQKGCKVPIISTAAPDKIAFVREDGLPARIGTLIQPAIAAYKECSQARRFAFGGSPHHYDSSWEVWTVREVGEAGMSHKGGACGEVDGREVRINRDAPDHCKRSVYFGGTGTDQCTDHPYTPGCPVNCDEYSNDPRCGNSSVCEYYQTSSGTLVASPDNSARCGPAPY